MVVDGVAVVADGLAGVVTAELSGPLASVQAATIRSESQTIAR
jgi:hypothetical protein